EPAGLGLETLGIAAEDRDARAALGQRPGNGGADAGAAARDQCMLLRKVGIGSCHQPVALNSAGAWASAFTSASAFSKAMPSSSACAALRRRAAVAARAGPSSRTVASRVRSKRERP